METIKISQDDLGDQAIEYPISSNDMEAIVRFYPTLMSSQDYEFLAKEIKGFHKAFWNMQGEVDWKECIGSNEEMEDYIYDFFRSCSFIKPLEEMEKRFEMKFREVQ